MYRIDAEQAIIGNGDIIKNASIVIDNDKITYAGESEHAPKTEEIIQTNTVSPGFWDCHGHFFGQKNFSHEEEILDVRVKILRCVSDLNELLSCGVTSIRELGGLGIFLKKAVNEGSIVGPRIYPAGNMISMTAGHGDSHSLDTEIFRMQSRMDRISSPIADGIAECLKLVRTQIRGGAEIIKFAASGGVMSEIDHPTYQQFSYEEQKAMVEEAARADMATAAHCYSNSGIRTALKAGVKTIEHGTYLDEDLCDMMIEKDAILVPTVYTYKGLFDTPEAKANLPEYGYRKGQLILKTHMEMLKMAIKRGVRIATGTDIITTGPYHPIYKYGDNLRELEYLVDGGMTPLQAITAGTGNGPLTLGKRAPKSGLLKENYDSDLVLFKKSPLEDIKLVNQRDNIQLVIRSGTIH